jgi:hypothetical protein
MRPNAPSTLPGDLEQLTKAEYESKSWQEQSETIRRLNGRALAHVAALIDSGHVERPVLEMLARVSGIAKAWAGKDGDETVDDLTDAELEDRAKR